MWPTLTSTFQNSEYLVDPRLFFLHICRVGIAMPRSGPSSSLARLISKNLPAAHTAEHLERFRKRERENQGQGGGQKIERSVGL